MFIRLIILCNRPFGNSNTPQNLKYFRTIEDVMRRAGGAPHMGKVSEITPVYKKGAKDSLGNYRPISVLPLLAKVFEKLINKQLLHYFETNNLFYDEQYGFRKKYSTKLSLASLANDMSKSLDEGKITLGVFIDFRKAFDTINHNILCKKLEYYGVKGLHLQWIRNYLSDRTQFVTYDGKLSCKKDVTCGVPQGSVLGPTLFLIYINDLPASSEHFTFKIFADDTNLFHTFPTDEHDIDMLPINRHLQDVVNWCKVNKLTINMSKTNYIVIRGRHRSVNIKGEMKIENSLINEVDSVPFVGLNIDKHLNWKVHIQKVNANIRKKVGILYRLRNFVPMNILVLLYKALLQPHLEYGIEAWGNNYESTLKCLYISQKMAVRAITFSTFLTPSKPIFQRLQILDIFQLHRLCVCSFMFNLINGNLPHSIARYCSFVSHRYSTRHNVKNNLYLPKVKTNYGKFSLSFVGASYWNELPMSIRQHSSSNSFRKSLKSLIMCAN